MTEATGQGVWTVETPVESGELRRDEIVRKAASLFSTRGYTSTSVREVAEMIGMSKAGLYHHFPTKEAILEEIAEDAIDALMRHLEQVLVLEGSVIEQLRQLVIGRVEVIAANHSALSVFWQERGLIGEGKNDELDDRMRAYHRSVVELIERGQQQGDVHPDIDAHIAMLGLLGLTGWTYLWYNPSGQLTPAEIGESFWNLIRAGLCIEGAG